MTAIATEGRGVSRARTGGGAAETPRPPAVRLQSVRKSFGSHVAVDGIDLDVGDGEFLTLLGASGCGKTTTLRLVAGFDRPTEGRVLIGGHDVTEAPAHHRPVHTVFQSYALFPHLTVADNLAFPLRIRKAPREERERRIAETLALVQMQGYEERRPSQLSGGQQQRIALARALVNQPRVLLLDEPLGALDLKLRKEMQIELKHMQRRLGITFIFVTHDQEEALAMSDRIALMQDGRMVQVADPVALYDRPATRYAAEFIGEMNFLDARVAEADAGAAVVEVGGRRVRVETAGSVPPVGSAVTAAVRPEAVDLAGAGEDGLAFEGRIAETIFVGTDRRIEIACDGGATLIARVQNRRALSSEPGDRVTAHVPASAIRLLTT